MAVSAGAGMAFVPTESFTAVALDRPGDMDVVIDGAGALELGTADCVDDNGWSDLVTVTNRLHTGADITVALQDPANGTLKGGSGGSRTFTLAQGGSETVEYKYEGSGDLPDDFDYDVSATGTGLTADATRDATVTSDGTCEATPTPTPDPDNEPPVADFVWTEGNGNKVDLDGSPSSDPDGTIVSYEWDIGNDGNIEHTGETVTDAKAKSGDEIKLIVTDDAGATDEVVKTI